MGSIQQIINDAIDSLNTKSFGLRATITEEQNAINLLNIEPDNTCIYIKSNFSNIYKLYITKRNNEFYGVTVYNDEVVQNIYKINTHILKVLIFESIERYLTNPFYSYENGLIASNDEENEAIQELSNNNITFVKSYNDMKLYFARKDNIDYGITISCNYNIKNIYILKYNQNIINNLLERHHN
jgi:hypothetical protein